MGERGRDMERYGEREREGERWREREKSHGRAGIELDFFYY